MSACTSSGDLRPHDTRARVLYFFLPFFFELPWLATGVAAASAGAPPIIPVGGKKGRLDTPRRAANRDGLAGPPAGYQLPRRLLWCAQGRAGLSVRQQRRGNGLQPEESRTLEPAALPPP